MTTQQEGARYRPVDRQGSVPHPGDEVTSTVDVLCALVVAEEFAGVAKDEQIVGGASSREGRR